MTELNQPPVSEVAVDTSIARRPGHPMEREPEPIANAHWLKPDRQPPQAGVLMDPSRTELTATFGTEHPPRGVSGMLRRAAYKLPDYRARRWALLIFADRVDALEAKLVRTLKHPVTWLVVAGVSGAFWQMRSRPRRFALR
jgi:hypothetical protein